MVRVFLKSSLPARHLFQVSFGRLRSLLLKRFFQRVEFLPNPSYRFSGERLSIRIRGEIHNAHIHSQKLLRIGWNCIGNVDHDIQEELPPGGCEIRLAAHHVPVDRRVMAEDQGNGDSSVDRGDGSVGQGFEGEEPLVVFHRGIFPEGMKRLLLWLVTVGDLGDGAYDHLGGQGRKPLPGLEIHQMVQFHLAKNFRLEGLSGDPVTGFIKLLHGRKKSLGLFLRRCQFDFNRFIHIYTVFNIRFVVNHSTEKNIAFLPSFG